MGCRRHEKTHLRHALYFLPAFLLGLCFLLPGPAAGRGTLHLSFEEPARDPQTVQEARAILSGQYQTELPGARDIAPLPPVSVHVLPDIISKIFSVLLVIFVVVVLVNFFYAGSPARGNGPEADADPDGEVDFAGLQVPDPEHLASRGLFTEAIHAVLLRSLVLASRRLDLRWPRSLTSREILRHGKLPVEARNRLEQLIQRVEVHHFGGLTPAEADYRRCLEIYERLAGSLRKGTP